VHQGAADPVPLDGRVDRDRPDGGDRGDDGAGIVLDRARRQQQVAHHGASGDGDEGQPALRRLVADPVDDVGLLRTGERRELDGPDRGDVGRGLEADRDGQRVAGPVAAGRQRATAVRSDSGIGRETGTGWM
jgi:hypothetical protein